MLIVNHVTQLASVPDIFRLLIKERLCIRGNVEIVLIQSVDGYLQLYGKTMPFDGVLDYITVVICVCAINNSQTKEVIIPKNLLAQMPFFEIAE